MYQSSEAFGSQIQQDSRTFHARITLSGKTITDGIMKITMNGGSNSEDDFSIGSAVSQYVEITAESGTQYEGHEFLLEFGMDVNGKSEYIPIGYFTAEKPEADENQISFTAYDRMMKMEQTCSLSLPEQTDTISVLNGISQITGVQVITTGLKAYTISLPVGYTCREVMSYISQMYGGFAICNRYGQIEIQYYRDSQYTIQASRYWGTFTHNDYEYVVGKITCYTGTDDDDEDTSISVDEGNGREISISNPFMTQDVLNDMWSSLCNFTYMPGEVKFLGDPRIDPWDVLTVQDRNGTDYKIPAMKIVQEYDGGLTTTITAEGKTEAEQSNGFEGPTTKQMDRYYAQLVLINKAIIDKADIKYLQSNYVSTDTLKALYAKIESLEATTITTEYMETNYAKVNLANIENGCITTAMIGTGVIGTAQIADNSITDAKIVSLAASKITAGTIDASVITVTNLNADNITAGSINGQRIADGAVSTSKLADYTVSAEKLSTGTGGNLLTDYDSFEQITNSNLYYDSVGGSAEVTQDEALYGQKSCKVIPSKTGTTIYLGDEEHFGNLAVVPGGTYIISCYMRAYGSNTVGLICAERNSDDDFYDQDLKTTKETISIKNADGWKRCVMRITPTYNYIALYLYVASTTCNVYFDGIQVERVLSTKQEASDWSPGGTVVVNGGNIIARSITSAKIAAKAITANEIAANTITADKMNISSLSAISANIGTVTAGILQSANYSKGDGAYTGAGTYIDLSSGKFNSKNFGIDESGNAYFKGTLYGADGSFCGEVIATSDDGSRLRIKDGIIYGEHYVRAGTYSTDTEIDVSAYYASGYSLTLRNTSRSIELQSDTIRAYGTNTENTTNIFVVGNLRMDGYTEEEGTYSFVEIDTDNEKPSLTVSKITQSVNINVNAYPQVMLGYKRQCSLCLNASENFGLYDHTNKKWLIYENSGGTVTCAGTSDRREKNDYGEAERDKIVSVLRNIRAHNFSYINDQSSVRQTGFIAQDLRDALINSGIGYDPVVSVQSEDGEEFYPDFEHAEEIVRYGIDYAKFVPFLHGGWLDHEERLSKIEKAMQMSA